MALKPVLRTRAPLEPEQLRRTKQTFSIINLASFLGLAAINNFDENSLKKEKKSFFYSGGLIEGTETILFYLLICLFPDRYIILTYFFSILVFFTALIRLYLAKKLFK